MSSATPRPPKLPPAWFRHAFWRGHRAMYRLSGGRFLWTTSSKRGWGALHLTTVGRKSGQERSVIIGYLEDGPNLVALAMNGWDEGHPAWWLNLEAHPDAVVRLAHQQPRPVHARRPPETNVSGCGSAGPRSTSVWMPMPVGARPRRPSSSSNPGKDPAEGTSPASGTAHRCSTCIANLRSTSRRIRALSGPTTTQ